MAQFILFFQEIPTWAYVIVAIVLFLLLYLSIKKARKRPLKNNNPVSLSNDDPITLQIPRPIVVPGNAQHIGSRTEQQDAFGFSDVSDEEFSSKYGVLALLADGMGGLVGGKEASHLAVQAFLAHYLYSTSSTFIPERLVSSLKAANEAVLQFAREHEAAGNIGTTFIAAVVFNQQLYWLSVGDSRIYLKQGESFIQLTTDHNYGMELDEKAANGEITLEEAANDPQRESLTSFLGLESLERIDVTIDPVPLSKGDCIILCSDGLYGSLTNHEIVEICSSFSTQEAAEKLVELGVSKNKPNQDNATVALLTIE